MSKKSDCNQALEDKHADPGIVEAICRAQDKKSNLGSMRAGQGTPRQGDESGVGELFLRGFLEFARRQVNRRLQSLSRGS